MTKRVQIVGGDTAAADAFTGKNRELYVDTELFELRIHDGTTAGGHRLLTKTQYDTYYQPLDATLTALAGIVVAANKMIYATGVDAFATTSLTSFARTILDDADAITVRSTLGLEIGVDVQAYSAILSATTESFTTADGIKLDGVESGATADQTGAEIKSAYEVEVSAFTDAQFTKLAGIETAADVTDAVNVAAAGASMNSDNLASLDSASAAFGNIKQAASAIATGVVELASQAEVNAGADANRVVTPETLEGLIAGKADITIVATDILLFGDSSNGGLQQKGAVQDILNLMPAGVTTFESSEQTITSSGFLTIAHSLGAEPKFIETEIVCQSTNLGWVAGDVLPAGSNNMTNSSTSCFGTQKDDTNIYVKFGSNANVFQMMGTSGTSASIDKTKWKMIVRGWL